MAEAALWQICMPPRRTRSRATWSTPQWP